MGGAASSDTDAVDANEHQVEVEPGETGFGEGARQLVGVAARHTPRHHQFQVGPDGKFGGDVERICHYGEPLAVGQSPRHLGRRRATGQPHRHLLFDPRSRLARYASLLLRVPDRLVAKRQLVGHGAGKRPSVRAHQEALVLQ